MHNYEDCSDNLVSVVIPTIGRASLDVAIQSVLAQTHRQVEVVVSSDSPKEIDLPSDNRIVVVRTGGNRGGNIARNLGIEAAQGSIIALLDDDDYWSPDKLRVQLAGVPPTDRWIATCYCFVWKTVKSKHTVQIWPRAAIENGQGVGDYLFRRRDVRSGYAFMPSSSLVAPASLFREVPLNNDLRIHQDFDWLLRAAAVPGVQLVQTRIPLVTYRVAGTGSVSEKGKSQDSVDWAESMADLIPRNALSDYYLTIPVFMAARSGEWRVLQQLVRRSLATGRPHLSAVLYAVTVVLRAQSRRIRGTSRRIINHVVRRGLSYDEAT